MRTTALWGAISVLSLVACGNNNPIVGMTDGAVGQTSAELRCCPASWNMYSCRESDGGPGMACHNPALGCASSEICGVGCDFEVTGRCACVQTELCVRGSHFDSTLCRCVPDPVTDAGVCVQTELCVRGDHFDRTLCRCVPDTPADAGTCIQNVLCIRGDHFDRTLCRCVPDETPDAGVCIQNVLCTTGSHFDRTLCRCVPDGNACESAADCRGVLPQLCRACDSGGDGCAHWACNGGRCEIAFCE